MNQRVCSYLLALVVLALALWWMLDARAIRDCESHVDARGTRDGTAHFTRHGYRVCYLTPIAD